MKKNIYRYLCFILFLASLCLCSCSNAFDNVTFDVPESVEVNYHQIYDLPKIVAYDKEGAGYIASVKVKNSSGKWVQIFNNSLPVEDINGYEAIYTINFAGNSLSKTMEIKVKDSAAPKIVIDKQKPYIVNLFNGNVEFQIPVDKIIVTDNKTEEPTVTYKVFFGENEVELSDENTFEITENGVYEVKVKAEDEAENTAEKSFNVIAINRNPEILMDFEIAEELENVYGYDLSSDQACSFELVTCENSTLPQDKYLGDKDNTLLKIKPLNKIALWPTFFFDFYETMPAGTTLKFKFYLDTLIEPQEGGYSVEVNYNWQNVFSTKIVCNDWIDVTAVLQEECDHMRVYLDLVGFDGNKNVFYDSSLLNIYIDDITVDRNPYIYLLRNNTIFTVNVSEGTFTIPVNMIRTAGQAPISLSYSAFFDDDELEITDNTFPLTEAGIYEIRVNAEDDEGRQSQKTFYVNAVNASPDEINFENETDTYFISSADTFTKDSFCAYDIEKAAYTDLGINAPGGGGQYCAKLTPVNFHGLASMPGQGIFIDIGRKLLKNEEVNFRLYFKTDENLSQKFNIISDSNTVTASYAYNSWINVKIKMSSDADYVHIVFKAPQQRDHLSSFIANPSLVEIYIDTIVFN